LKARVLVTALLAALLLYPVVAPSQGKLTVGILHVGSINDAGYNQAHAEGIQVMKRTCPRWKSSRWRTSPRAPTPSA